MCIRDRWGTILDILKEKVREGVEVRFMYDGMCAISMLPYNYPEQIARYGIKCKMANSVKPFLSTTQNNRDHRKICVIDGKVGYTGGINLGDESVSYTHLDVYKRQIYSRADTCCRSLIDRQRDEHDI